MARPQKTGLDYFPHDTDASNDEKIEALTILHGNNGYAFYFIHLERIYRTNNFELDVSDAETRQILCQKCRINHSEYDQILKTAIKHGCFDAERYEKEGVLTSPGIKKRANVVVEKRKAMQKKYNQNNGVLVSASETTQETTQETVPETRQSKVKESKEKNNNDPPPSPNPVSRKKAIPQGYSPEFEELWNGYRKKENKAEAYSVYLKRVKDYQHSEILRGVKFYTQQTKATEPRYLKGLSVLLNYAEGTEIPKFREYLDQANRQEAKQRERQQAIETQRIQEAQTEKPKSSMNPATLKATLQAGAYEPTHGPESRTVDALCA